MYSTNELRRQKTNVTNYLHPLNSNKEAIYYDSKFPVLLYHSLETITIAVNQAAHSVFRRLQNWMLGLLASLIFLWFSLTYYLCKKYCL
jgi:hypothetical protein